MPIDHLPEKVQPLARRVRNWSLTDRPILVILGLGILARGISYLPVFFGAATAIHPAERLMSMTVWAWVWITIGTVCLIASKVERLAAAAVGMGVGIHTVWGLSFIAETLLDFSPRSWVSSVGYLSIAALVMLSVWRGSREVIPKGAVADELRKS